MTKVPAYAAASATAPLGPYTVERRDPGPHDVHIDILFCGICHSDIHQVRDEWGGSIFPMVPGHEIVGRVNAVGAHVTKFKAGDMAGVGCMVDSCRECGPCQRDRSSSARRAPPSPTTAPRWTERRPPTAATRRRSWWTSASC